MDMAAMQHNVTRATTTFVTLQREPDGDLCEVRCVHPDKVVFGRGLLLPAEEYRSLADIFAALADPSRAKIVYSLLHQELCTCDLAAIADISESAVSQHLRVLRRLRLVKSRREGKMVYHSLDDEHIRTLLEVCLEHVRVA
jgi:ArsR family transcriptional regulator, lead/cadmium/zinc/bismuth-responsive transcriptional repressor